MPNEASRIPSTRFATTTGNRQVYAAIFIDGIMVKIRDGQRRNRPVYAAI
jgi:transposase-like protein